jgi:hypothetical protein
MQVTIHGLLVLPSFVLCYVKYRNVYVHESDCNRIGHVVRKVHVCACLTQFSCFVSSCSRVQIFGDVSN